METVDKFIFNLATVILNPLIRLMFAVAVIYFLWGVFKYIVNSDSDNSRQTGGKHILFGLIGIVVMMGVYGILNIATSLILN